MRIAVLVSGSGSNLQAILDAAASDPAFAALPVVVIADRDGIQALDRATVARVPTEVVAWSDFTDRAAFTKAVCDTADRYDVDALVLAGFMRILSPEAVERFPILNIHPSMLPAFVGAHALEAAIAHGVKVTGVTVHFVDERVDHGPIIAQVPVTVRPDDTVASLQARIQEIEHRLYPSVIKAFANGLLETDGRVVTWKDDA